MGIEHARFDQPVPPGGEKRVYQIAEARDAIADGARATLQRVLACGRMNPGQRDQIVAEIEALLKRSDDPTAARQLDALDNQARRILKHVE